MKLGPVVHTLWARLWRLWDALAIYIPVLLMGVLALGTYWLARNAPVSSSAEAAKQALHESDYFMRDFTVKTFDPQGRLKSEIVGVEARHYPATDTLEIDQARIHNLSPEGRVTSSSANRVLSNGDGSEVQLLGNALLVREAGPGADTRLAMSGEFLHAFVKDERVTSHKPVVLTRGEDRFSGDSFSYDGLSGVVELKGRVKGLLVAKSGRPASAAR